MGNPNYKHVTGPLADDKREKLFALVQELGAPAVLRESGISAVALWRAIGGGTLHAGTVLMLESLLERIGNQK